MSDRIQRIDFHSEMTGTGPVPMPHFVDAEPTASQSIVRMQSEPVLCQGDVFRCLHQPTAGPFQTSLPGGTGEGHLKDPGQQILRINGHWAYTLNGTNCSCSEAAQEMSNRATVIIGRSPVLKVNGEPLLIGR